MTLRERKEQIGNVLAGWRVDCLVCNKSLSRDKRIKYPLCDDCRSVGCCSFCGKTQLDGRMYLYRNMKWVPIKKLMNVLPSKGKRINTFTNPGIEAVLLAASLGTAHDDFYYLLMLSKIAIVCPQRVDSLPMNQDGAVPVCVNCAMRTGEWFNFPDTPFISGPSREKYVTLVK